ncbi:zinc knuckle CX2CX4HX4C containing protein [Tanacetum coccineum]
MERGFLSSNLKTKNKNGDKNDKQTLHVDDDLVKNDLAAKIKNIDGKFVGRKSLVNCLIQLFIDASCISLCNCLLLKPHWVSKEGIIETSKDNSSGGNVQNLLDNIHAANGQPCDGFPSGLSQVDDQCKDSGTCGKQDVNAWDTPFIKPVSFENEPGGSTQQKKTIKITELHNEEVVEGAAMAIPSVVVKEVRNKFANTLYGYFVGKRLAFLLVENYVKNTWAKFGLERVMLRNGFFLFQFSTREGMERVLENGPWLIRLVLLILNIWSPNTILQKDEITLALVWVKIHNVPIVAYSEIGLSLIATKLGSAKALLDSLVVAIPLPNGKGNTLETINIEYEWKPQAQNRKKKKGKDGPRTFGGIKLPKPKRKVMGSKKGSNGEPTSGGTKEGDLKAPSPTRATSDLNTPFSNPFDVLNTVYGGCRSKKASKSQDHEDDSEEESEVKEYPLYDSTGISSIGAGFSLEDDDLACYDGYEAKLYNLSGKSQAFCDNYDIRLNSRVRK